MTNSKFFSLLAIAIALLMDLAALDDITTGSEPSYIGEYLAILLSIPFIYYCILIYKGKRKFGEDKFLGFLGFLGFCGLPALLQGDFVKGVWCVWFVWFLYFLPIRKTEKLPDLSER